MKKPSFLVAALVAIALTACGKKEEPAPVAAPAPVQQPAPAPVQEAAEAAEEAVEEAAEATEEAAEEAKSAVEAAVEQAREAGAQAVEQVTEKATEAVEEVKQAAEAAVAGAMQAAGIATVAPMSAADAEKLATAKNCMACHAVDRKLVGPSYKEVAEKRGSEEGAVALLAEKIQKGGAGVYGPVPMPPNPQVNAEEAAQLAQWVLSLN
jgi:cytochrome c